MSGSACSLNCIDYSLSKTGSRQLPHISVSQQHGARRLPPGVVLIGIVRRSGWSEPGSDRFQPAHNPLPEAVLRGKYWNACTKTGEQFRSSSLDYIRLYSGAEELLKALRANGSASGSGSSGEILECMYKVERPTDFAPRISHTLSLPIMIALSGQNRQPAAAAHFGFPTAWGPAVTAGPHALFPRTPPAPRSPIMPSTPPPWRQRPAL